MLKSIKAIVYVAQNYIFLNDIWVQFDVELIVLLL